MFVYCSEVLLGTTCPLILCSDHAYKSFFNALLDSAELRGQPGSMRQVARRCVVQAHSELGNDAALKMLDGSGDRQCSNAARAVLYDELMLCLLEDKAEEAAI